MALAPALEHALLEHGKGLGGIYGPVAGHESSILGADTGPPVRPPAYDRRWMSTLQLGDPLAHRALHALLRAEAAVRRRLAVELEREGVSAAGFSALVVLTTAGGSLELRTLRRRLGWSKANATEVTATLCARGLVTRRRVADDRRAVAIDLTDRGSVLVERLFPGHADRVRQAFGVLDEGEKRSLVEICRKLAV